MQTQRTLLDDLKHQFKYGGMTIKLIFANVAVWLVLSILGVVARNSTPGVAGGIGDAIQYIFYLNSNPSEFITQPWGAITSIFSHVQFLHILFNMLLFYFAGKMFEREFDQKRLFYTYLLGGILGSLLQVVSSFLPMAEAHPVIGASGAVMAVFMALAFYKPRTTVNLFGLLPVPLYVLAGVLFLKDFFSLGEDDGVAHFAHLGGAILGMVSVIRVHSSGNIINVVQGWGDAIQRLFSRKRGPSMKRTYGTRNVRMKTDEQYNVESQDRQQEIDRILDKISKSGYESLSKREKDFLFKQSKNGQ